MNNTWKCALAALLTTAGAASLSCSESTLEPYEPVVGTRLLMNSMLDPAADTFWDAVRTEMTLEGTTDYKPRTDEEWTAVRNAAIVLAESGNLLMMGRRAVDEGDWLGWSYQLRDAGEAAMQAAESRDPAAVFDIGEKIYFACAGCHAQYWQADFSPPAESAFTEKSGDSSE